jgi:phosphatidate cytidylyltransferase
MLRDRIALALLLLPALIWVIADGGWLFAGAVTLVLALAAVEYGQLFRRQGLRPSLPLLVFGVATVSLARFASGFEHAHLLLSALVLASMVWHLIDFERGAQRSGTDFALTVAGVLYLGWVGAYLISLRRLPYGEWWLLLALPSVMLADSAAYLIGRRFGRRPLAPRLSPKKTWEGYLAGVAGGALAGTALAALWQIGAGPGSPVHALTGLALGTALAVLTPLGDLGESMIKREIGVKDSGDLLPGHGGALDRVDSWLWAGVLGYYAALALGGLA